MNDLSCPSDTIYANKRAIVEPFTFDNAVAEVFPNMIQRSVPGYQTILHTLSKLSHQFQMDNAYYYDLGCSLGAATLAMRQAIQCPGGKIIAVDNSEAMLTRCQQQVNAFSYPTPVEYRCQDIQETKIENAAIVVLNFTLQFLPIEQRQMLINYIFQGLKAGGLLFISEKIKIPTTKMEAQLSDLHLDFKRQNGYSDLEISQKRSALEDVLQPDTLNTHYQRFKTAGFPAYETWFQQFNFASILAIKGA